MAGLFCFYILKEKTRLVDYLVSYYLDDNKDKTPQNLEDSLKLADWVVVALLDNDPSRPESQSFRQLLAQKPELLLNKKVVVFAFGTILF